MPEAYKNFRPANCISNGDIQKKFHISRDLVNSIVKHLQPKEIQVTAPNGRILHYYSKSFLEEVEAFLKQHPDTRSYFLTVSRQQDPQKYVQARERAKQTMRDRYGAINASQIKEMQQKKARNFELQHGCTFSEHMHLRQLDPETQRKRELTCIEKFGENYKDVLRERRQAAQTPEVRKRAANKCKQTSLLKYGVENPLQVPEIVERARETRKQRTIMAQQMVHEMGGVTEQEIVEELGVTDPCIRAHMQILGIAFQKQGPLNYISQSEYALLKPGLQAATTSHSGEEVILRNFVTALGVGEIISNTRAVIPPKELDIYIPSHKVAIEYNGLFWRSVGESQNYRSSSNYHLQKTLLCESQGIRLLQFFEDEWLYKRSICESLIRSAVGIYQQRIYARQCSVQKIDQKEYREFWNTNHIQGAGPKAATCIGLFHRGDLVQVVGFGKSRYKQGEIELLRMATKLNCQVIGGFSKLIAHSGLEEFISYVDRRLFTGSGYQSTGFQFVGYSKPSYFYTKGGQRYNRLNFQKHKLPKILDHFDPKLTEIENMLKNGYRIIYDCGTIKVKWKK